MATAAADATLLVRHWPAETPDSGPFPRISADRCGDHVAARLRACSSRCGCLLVGRSPESRPMESCFCDSELIWSLPTSVALRTLFTRRCLHHNKIPPHLEAPNRLERETASATVVCVATTIVHMDHGAWHHLRAHPSQSPSLLLDEK